MESILKAAWLSLEYTNHSVRATTVVHLKQAGVDNRKICEISGHSNPTSLASYDKTSPVQAVKLSEKIDCQEESTSSPAIMPVTTCSASCVAASSSASLTSLSDSSSAFVFNAAGLLLLLLLLEA